MIVLASLQWHNQPSEQSSCCVHWWVDNLAYRSWSNQPISDKTQNQTRDYSRLEKIYTWSGPKGGKDLIHTCIILGFAKSFLLRAITRLLVDRRGWRSWFADDNGICIPFCTIRKHRIEKEEIGVVNSRRKGIRTRESRTSMTRSASLRRALMARVAAAMWPGNQLMLPPPLVKPISPNPFFSIFPAPPILVVWLNPLRVSVLPLFFRLLLVG